MTYKKYLLGIIVFLILTFIPFRDYFLRGRIAFDSNLLVAFFAPWNTMKFPGWEQGVPYKPMGIDNVNLFYPYKDLSIDLIKKGQWPLWNPYNFTGNVLLANFQSSIFYPLNVVYFFLPTPDAWSWLVMIQPILAGLFTYIFLRCFALQRLAAFFGALVFAFSGEMIVWMGDHLVVSHTILWLPLILCGIEKFLTQGKRHYFLIAIGAMVSSFFAGFFQPFFYVAATSFLYVLFRTTKARTKDMSSSRVILTFALFFLSIGIAAVQLIPSIEAYIYSARRVTDAGYLSDIYLMPLSHLISFLAPDYLGNPASFHFFGRGAYHESMLFIGVVPLVFALLAMKEIKNQWPVQFFSILCIGTLIFGFNIPFIRYFYTSNIPLLSTFLPSRIFFITTFALSILSAFGLNAWLTKKEEKWMIIGVFSLFIGIISMLFVYVTLGARSQTVNQFLFRLSTLSIPRAEVLQRNLVIPFLTIVFSFCIFLLARRRKFKMIGCVLLLLITISGQQYFARKYIGLSERAFVYPEHPVFTFLKNRAGLFRFWTYGEGYINANFATQYRLFSPDGTDALFSSRLGEVFFASENKGKLSTSIPRIDVRVPRLAQGWNVDDNPYRLRLLSLIGVKYVTDWESSPETPEEAEKKFPSSLFTLVDEKDRWKIYEYKDVLPRAFFSDRYVVASDSQRILDILYDPSHSLTDTILEEEPAIQTGQTGKFQEARIVSYAPNEVIIEANREEPLILFLSDSYFPGWNAYVDGVKTKVHRANYAFRAVEVPPGVQRVVFRYEPASLRLGVWISIGSIGCFLIIIILKKRRIVL